MANSRREHGGTIVNIITAVVFFGLLGYGIMWLIKGYGQAGEQYAETMVQAKHDATSVKCQMNLRTIGQNIQMYVISNGTLPASLEELIDFSGSTQLFKCPSPEGEQYKYIPGQGGNCPDSNVLLFEPKAVHDGRAGVLRLGGQVELLTPEELQQAVNQTLAGLGR
ncbi:MAG TPA: hypothetical protein ENI81_04350 [Phycisphaerales bacterium]|mgnify:CR=1 FL=1|nr:hypothetical protein [Phycisphaerales bacterium]